MKRVFCIGNGESRVGFDLAQLKPYGKIYGCNALYRDFPELIDVLTAVDDGIIHEIYRDGFALKKNCYFRNWTKVPASLYETMLQGFCSKQELSIVEDYDGVHMNERGKSKEFVIQSSTVSGEVSILKNTTKEIIEKTIDNSQINVSWIKENDKSHDLKDIVTGREDHGWASGPTSAFVACNIEQPKEIYLIGHDIKSDNKKINNAYKGTKYYVTPQGESTPYINWVSQWYTLMDWYPNVKFFKVNKEKNGMPTNRPIHQWEAWENRGQLVYLTQAQLIDKLLKNDIIE